MADIQYTVARGSAYLAANTPLPPQKFSYFSLLEYKSDFNVTFVFY